MKILMAASEVEPYSKTGGLADVLGALPVELARRGHQLAVVSPLYRSTKLRDPKVVFDSLIVPIGAAMHSVRVLAVTERQVKFYFVAYPPFYDREALYGTPQGDYPDNAQRFLLLSKAVVEIARLDFHPEVMHCHDWQTGMVPVLLKTAYASDSRVNRVPLVFGIHNLGYQGLFPSSMMAALGLPLSLLTPDALEFYSNISFIKGGLVFADAITTVSEAYAREIQTREYGFGLDGLLSWRSSVLTGILNGVNYEQWDPRSDSRIASCYSSENLEGKHVCKRDLIETFGLGADGLERPVIGMVSRIASQKGADLVEAAVPELMSLGVSMAMVGKGDPADTGRLLSLASRFPRQFVLQEAQDETLAHKIEAGSDMFLMPSRYEPCGLNQMYSLRYGTVPIVRATGGLDDTIEPFDAATGKGNGFKFRDYSAMAMLAAIREALGVYRQPAVWQQLMRNGMAEEFSWARAVPRYEQVYQRALAARAG